jgi:hypothetical protein
MALALGEVGTRAQQRLCGPRPQPLPGGRQVDVAVEEVARDPSALDVSGRDVSGRDVDRPPGDRTLHQGDDGPCAQGAAQAGAEHAAGLCRSRAGLHERRMTAA